MSEVISINSKTKGVIQHNVYSWQCDFCLCDYTYTKGSPKNVRCVKGGSEDNPLLICEACASEINHMIGGVE